MILALMALCATAAPVLENGVGLHDGFALDERDLSVWVVGHALTWEHVGWPSETAGFGWTFGLGGGVGWEPATLAPWPQVVGRVGVRFGAPQPRLRPYGATGVRARYLVGSGVMGAMYGSGGLEVPVGDGVVAVGLRAEVGSRGNVSTYGGGLELMWRWRS